jgi:hypothetical protein
MGDPERMQPDIEVNKESTDKGFSASVDSIGGLVLMNRPQENTMYELYFETDRKGKEEVAFVGMDTKTAEEDFKKVTDFLRDGNWKTMEEAKMAARDFIVKLHGGIQEAK